MQEPIIIDGVDVSGCKYIEHSHLCREFQEYAICKITDIAAVTACAEKHDCYYKQLQRKTQEVERYHKEWINCAKQLDLYKNNEQYMQEKHYDLTIENDQLKSENESMRCELDELKEKHHNVLNLAKMSADTSEYCMRELEKQNEELKIQNESLRNHISDLLQQLNDLKEVQNEGN